MGGSVVPYAMASGGCAIGAMVALTVHMPLYYEAVYHLSASESGLALIPLAAMAVPGAWLAGWAMTRTAHYKRIAVFGTGASALMAAVLVLAPSPPLWAMLVLLSAFAFGLGTTFPVNIVAIQNAVARTQIGTATGAANFFRALMASFLVAAFTTILLMALGDAAPRFGESLGAGAAVSADEMVAAFRYLFAASALLLAAAALCILLMEERPLAGGAAPPAEMAE